MEPQNQIAVNAALDHVLVNRYICGVLFYVGYPRLVVDQLSETAKPVRDGIGVYVASTWELFDAHPGSEVGNASGFSDDGISDLCRVAGSLMNVRITSASVVFPLAHLLIGFEDGRVLALDGSSEVVEGWEVNSGDFGVVASMGNGVAYWTPDHFKVPTSYIS